MPRKETIKWTPSYYLVLADKDNSARKKTIKEVLKKYNSFHIRTSGVAPAYLQEAVRQSIIKTEPDNYLNRKITETSDLTIKDCIDALTKGPSTFEKFLFLLAGYGWGTGFWKSNVIHYQLMKPGEGHIIDSGYELEPINFYDEEVIRDTIEHYGSYLNITFIEAKSSILKNPTNGNLTRPQIRIGLSHKGFWGGSNTAGTGYYPGMKFGGDIIMRPGVSNALMAHELGHVMGLTHPKSDVVIFLRNFAEKYLGINYKKFSKDSGFDGDFTCMTTGMFVSSRNLLGMHDILALQSIYGARKIEDTIPQIFQFKGTYIPDFFVSDFDGYEQQIRGSAAGYVIDNPLFAVIDGSQITNVDTSSYLALDGRPFGVSSLVDRKYKFMLYKKEISPRSRIYSFVTSSRETHVNANGLENTIILNPYGRGKANGNGGLDNYVFPTSLFKGYYIINDSSGRIIFPDIDSKDLALKRSNKDAHIFFKRRKIATIQGYYNNKSKRRFKKFRLFDKNECSVDKKAKTLKLKGRGTPLEYRMTVTLSGKKMIRGNFGKRIIDAKHKNLEFMFKEVDLTKLEVKKYRKNKRITYVVLREKNSKKIILGFKRKVNDLVIGYKRSNKKWKNMLVIKKHFRKRHNLNLRDKRYTSIEIIRSTDLTNQWWEELKADSINN